MKLTNLQLEALTKEFSKSEAIEKENAENFNKIKSDKQTIALAKKYHKALLSIPESIRRTMYMVKKEEDFILHIAKSKHTPKKVVDDYSQVRQKIIIASIEAKNLDELKKLVASKIKVK